ncbi:MAG TPA: methyltransferase domain-containing protein [Gemmatimonadaceae bacterium]|nr:methyltransferase domain-containing protein [Gemmatimonadaceae bacterium]
MAPAKLKTYDREYFERWYRDPRHRVATRESLARKVRMAVSLTEFLLGRTLRSVLDVGCGEAPWFTVLKRVRPETKYTGIEASDYALERYGASRNIRRGTLGSLSEMRLPRRIDLIVCADVLQYVSTAEVERGLRAIRHLAGGVAYIESFAKEDNMEGDRAGWIERSADEYRRLFRRAGLTQCGPYSFVNLDAIENLNVFEHC